MTWDTYTVKCIKCGGEFKTTGKQLLDNPIDTYVITKTGNRYILHAEVTTVLPSSLHVNGTEDSILDKDDLAKHLADGYHKLECKECKKDA